MSFARRSVILFATLFCAFCSSAARVSWFLGWADAVTELGRVTCLAPPLLGESR